MKILPNSRFNTFRATFEIPKVKIGGYFFDEFQVRTTHMAFFYFLHGRRMYADKETLFRIERLFFEKYQQQTFII